MTRTPYQLACEAHMLAKLADRLRRDAARAETRHAMSRETVRLYALAAAVESDAADIAEGREIIR